jgi:hypothetical protein
VVDRVARRILCACKACLHGLGDGEHARYRAIPTRVRVPDPPVTASDLETLGVPVGLAFLVRGSSAKRWVAVFPSPAGPTEAELPEHARAVASGIADDVEGLLVYRRRVGPLEAFIVPIDLCYELAGIVRRHWRGIDGGEEASAVIESFFARLRERVEEGRP